METRHTWNPQRQAHRIKDSQARATPWVRRVPRTRVQCKGFTQVSSQERASQMHHIDHTKHLQESKMATVASMISIISNFISTRKGKCKTPRASLDRITLALTQALQQHMQPQCRYNKKLRIKWLQ